MSECSEYHACQHENVLFFSRADKTLQDIVYKLVPGLFKGASLFLDPVEQQTISKRSLLSSAFCHNFVTMRFFADGRFLCFLNPDEMKRRRDFYAENRVLEPGEVVETFNIAEDEIISLSIQFYERNKWVNRFLFSPKKKTAVRKLHVYWKVAAETGVETVKLTDKCNYLIVHKVDLLTEISSEIS